MSFYRQFILFGLVGAAGFLVDTVVLYLLKDELGLYIARILSFPCAAFVTWLLNKAVTFRGRSSGRGAAVELVIYLGLMVIGGGINYLVYALLISAYQMIQMNPVLGVAAGSLAGMTVNLCTSRFLLFRNEKLQ